MSMEECQPEFEHPSPSVMLRFMGVDEFPVQQPVVKRTRVLSDGYLQKVASIGVRKKSAERFSLYMLTDEEKECEHVFNTVQTVRRDNCVKSLSRKRVANPASFEEMQFSRRRAMRLVGQSTDERFLNSKECREGPLEVAYKRVDKVLGWRQRLSRYCRAQGFSARGVLQSKGIRASESNQEQTNEGQHREFQAKLRGSNLCVKTREGKTPAGVSKHAVQSSRFSKQRWNKSAKAQHAESDTNSLYQNVMDVPLNKLSGIAADGMIEKGKQTRILSEKQFESCHNLVRETDEVLSSRALGAMFQQAASDKEFVSSYNSGSELESLISFEENHHWSPDSVMLPVGQEEISEVQSDLEQSEMSDVYSEGSCIVSGDEDNDKESISDRNENESVVGMLRAKERRNFSYLVDLLTEAGFDRHDTLANPGSWVISSHVLETLEKKYGEQITWKRSERRLFFDRVNSGLQEILQQSAGIQEWTKPVARRLILRQVEEAIEDELWMILACQERVATSESEMFLEKEDKWMDLTEEIQVIGREIEHSLIDELVEEAITVNVESC